MNCVCSTNYSRNKTTKYEKEKAQKTLNKSVHSISRRRQRCCEGGKKIGCLHVEIIALLLHKVTQFYQIGWTGGRDTLLTHLLCVALTCLLTVAEA